jgi:pyruvate formate lyase activating enzyme
LKVYHAAYETGYRSLDVHFWTPCNLACRACYTRYERLDFGLFDDPIAHIIGQPAQDPPGRFFSLEEVSAALEPLKVERAIFMGTEPALDPEMPLLAAHLHRRFSSYNVMLTNAMHLADLNDVDEVIVSLKTVNTKLHREYTGRDNAVIMSNFAALYRSGRKIQAETVLIPGYIDGLEIEKTARFIATISPDITLRIDAYFPVGDNPWPAASRQEVEEAARLARRHLTKVNCLTLDLKREGEKPQRIL